MLANVRNKSNSHSHGFTLVELLVTISIVGIVAAIGLPSMSQMTEQQRMKDLVFRFADDMQTARSESITKNTAETLTITSSNAGATWNYGCTTCTPAISNSSADYSTIKLTAVNAPITFASTGNATGSVAANATSVTMTSTNWTVKATVNPLGKVHVCSADQSGVGKSGLGFPAC